MDFAEMHHAAAPLLMANVWDAASASAAEVAGYAAIGTSSAAIAAMFGYADGEGLSFAELLAWVRRLRAVCALPLSVDMEAGYGEDALQIAENLLALHALGVVGVNLEDSVVRQGRRRLQDAHVFASQLRAIRAQLQVAGARLFINARTDVFLLGLADARAEAVARGQLYAAQGADGLFVPCVTTEADIAAIAQAVPLPLNVMCMPDLAPFEQLVRWGVKRISMGNFVHSALQARQLQLLQSIREQQSFGAVFSDANH